LTEGELFTIEGPVCAIESGGEHEVIVCPSCGRGRRAQTGNLRVSLVCQSRHVWFSDGNAVLVDKAAAESMTAATSGGISFRPVQAEFRLGLPWASHPVPDLVQVVAKNVIHAASQCVELDGCSCGAVRSISFEPLVVIDPEHCSRVWRLAENPEVLVVDAFVWEALLKLDPDLECGRVWREHEYSPPAPTSGGISWGDL